MGKKYPPNVTIEIPIDTRLLYLASEDSWNPIDIGLCVTSNWELNAHKKVYWTLHETFLKTTKFNMYIIVLIFCIYLRYVHYVIWMFQTQYYAYQHASSCAHLRCKQNVCTIIYIMDCSSFLWTFRKLFSIFSLICKWLILSYMQTQTNL